MPNYGSSCGGASCQLRRSGQMFARIKAQRMWVLHKGHEMCRACMSNFAGLQISISCLSPSSRSPPSGNAHPTAAAECVFLARLLRIFQNTYSLTYACAYFPTQIITSGADSTLRRIRSACLHEFWSSLALLWHSKDMKSM